MELTDIAPLEKWAAMEKSAFERTTLQSAVFDTKGVRITDTKIFANTLCPKIKSTDKGQTFICATAHMNMAALAQKNHKPVVEECDAGMTKIVVPIFAGGEFLGTAGGCGVLLKNNEIDSFAVNKITGIKNETISIDGKSIPMIGPERVDDIVSYYADQIESITKSFTKV